MSVTIDGTSGVTTPDVTSDSYTGPISVSSAAPNNSLNVDASGNLGVGTSSPSAANKLQVLSTVADNGVGIGGTTKQLRLSYDATGNYSQINSADWGTGQTDLSIGGLDLLFKTGIYSLVERARIDSSGNLLVGRTSTAGFGSTGVQIEPTGQLVLFRAANSTVQTFYNFTGQVIAGTISIGTNTTSYNTSSDYRLKNTIAPMTGALAKVAALKPCTYKWNADGSDGEGFIAHELAEVVPQCVTGEKDAVDADGNPVYQGIDTSFLVATLTAAIQEQQAIINSLTTRIAALEAK